MITTDIHAVAELLMKEGVAAIPTETVYGLAGNIYSEKAVNSIFAIKKRPLYNPLIVHIGRIEDIDSIAAEIPPAAVELARRCWPGPLTLLLKKNPSVPNLITAGKPTVAVRMPAHPVALALLQRLPFPLAAPSANPFGSISPTTAAHVQEYFNDELLVLDGGPCTKGIESTIVGFENGQPVIYRLGAVPAETIEAIAGKVSMHTHDDAAPAAPGMLARHYSPATPTLLTTDIEAALQEQKGKKTGLLLFSKPFVPGIAACQEVLSPTGSFDEAAAMLYAALHRLDRLGLDLILAELLPEEGLGRSINDRLRRAAAKE